MTKDGGTIDTCVIQHHSSPESININRHWSILAIVHFVSGLTKNILQGTVKEGRRQGRQKKRSEDNISESTGLEFAKSQRTVENREEWRNWL